MARLLALCLLGATGCFYIDPINQRPSIDIRQESSDEVFRGDVVALDAVVSDPETDDVFPHWRAYACTDASDPTTCDAAPFYTATEFRAQILVPVHLADRPVPTQSLLVILQAQDGRGAIARPDSRLILAVSDHPPVVDLRAAPVHPNALGKAVVGTPVDIFATVSDPDDSPPTNLTVESVVFSPSAQPSYTFGTLAGYPIVMAANVEHGWRLATNEGDDTAVGTWEVQVTATDPVGVSTQTSAIFELVADAPPCLRQWAPIAAPQGTALPVTEPTLFQVTVVEDDLDGYPTRLGDALAEPTAFSWSILEPGASTRTSLPVSSNSVQLDPASYTPGDVVELRVEIADRNDKPVTCADDQPTCSIISDDTCTQRLTWRVEVR